MANDAKLGLVCGVAIVLIVALVFFRPDTHSTPTKDNPSAAVPSEPAEIPASRILPPR